MEFHGINKLNLDAKGRLAMPARLKSKLMEYCNGEMVVTIDVKEKCLLIYPYPEWQDVQRRARALPGMHKKTNRMQRMLIGHAMDVQLDASGRILLPPPLREHAELEKQVVLVGQTNKLELWDDLLWAAYMKRCNEEEQRDEDEPPELREFSW